ncbi:MAG: hypothetical protein HC802_03605 [Caldilineaceae bacterium]|nr:hypothetical protein [Caldilineaceae bacterium]
MRKFSISLVVGILLIVVLGLTVYSQSTSPVAPVVQMLQSGVSQQVPFDVQIQVPTESGVQTVTVPLVLNLNLTVGPVEALDMNLVVGQASPFVSPLTTAAPKTSVEVTTTSTITTTP